MVSMPSASAATGMLTQIAGTFFDGRPAGVSVARLNRKVALPPGIIALLKLPLPIRGNGLSSARAAAGSLRTNP